jgi:hypothetical protein
LNPTTYLSRPDKWYVSGGNRLIWTPEFPLWLEFPGFWDRAHYYNFEIEPVFTWTLLDENGAEISLRAAERRWDPAGLTSRLRISGREGGGNEVPVDGLSSGLKISETKCCLPNDVLTSVIQVDNTSSKRKRLILVAWTIQRSAPSRRETWLGDVGSRGGRIYFTKHVGSRQGHSIPHFQFECLIGMSSAVRSIGIIPSEGSTLQPYWRFTPFSDKVRDGRLPDERKAPESDQDCLVYMALQTDLRLMPGTRREVAIFFSAAPARSEASSNLHHASRQASPRAVSRMNWEDYWGSVPVFNCSDPYFTRTYWYRWYGLKQLTLHGGELHYGHPAVCEGIGYFRAPISYSAVCHIRETRWMHDPSLGRGCFLTFLEHQRDDGAFRGYLDPHYYRSEKQGGQISEPFYHADWGRSLVEFDRVHHDTEYLAKVYDALGRYARYFDRVRDPEGSGLYDVMNHYETGQEYMHRYTAVNTAADKHHWGDVFRLKGVDAAVYIYELKSALSTVGAMIGKPPQEIAAWAAGASQIKQSILTQMWNEREEMFFDFNPGTGAHTMVKAATCFYPYMTDIVSRAHLPGFSRHLFNPREFWTPFPVPSSSADDEYFSPFAEWKETRMNCPWNGRVWPMTNSHVAEALAQVALRFEDAELRKRAAEFITKFIRMMFLNGNPARPNCYEHYNPITGTPSFYRGIDDYQHSWIVDLLIKYVAGVRPEANHIVIDPFPFSVERVQLENVLIRGLTLKVVRQRQRFSVWVNGRKYGDSRLGKPVRVDL